MSATITTAGGTARIRLVLTIPPTSGEALTDNDGEAITDNDGEAITENES